MSKLKTTYPTGQTITEELFPISVEEVSTIVKQNQTAPLHVVSRGMNYGYGNRVPPQDKSLLINLSKMDKIVEFNTIDGTITVQAGVTFLQVETCLQNSTWIIAGTGAPPQASLIGNLAQMGIGKGLTGNRFENSCDYQVVLNDGSIIQTGGPVNARTKGLTKYTHGSSIDGLFIQSNLGIITQATFFLSPRPTHICPVIFNFNTLEPTIEALKQLKMKGIIRANFALFNDYRIAGLFAQYPWQNHDGQSTLPHALCQEELRRLILIGAPWYGELLLMCHSRAQLRAEMKLVKKALKQNVNTVFFIDPLKQRIGHVIAALLRKPALQFMMSTLINQNGYLGATMDFTLKSAYWRKKIPPDNHPIDDDCGFMWLGPMIPFRAQDAQEAVALIEKIMNQFGFEPAITLQAVSERQLNAIISITWDRSIAGEDAKGLRCHDALMQALIANGFYPYRKGIAANGKPTKAEFMIKIAAQSY